MQKNSKQTRNQRLDLSSSPQGHIGRTLTDLAPKRSAET